MIYQEILCVYLYLIAKEDFEANHMSAYYLYYPEFYSLDGNYIFFKLIIRPENKSITDAMDNPVIGLKVASKAVFRNSTMLFL